MKKQRSQWGTRAGFILAAAGSAVGLGNIWRFPYVAYENGGGAFFIPYLFALITAGIPILIMEFAIGHKYRGSAPLSFSRMKGKKMEWVGWWGIGVAFFISTYYSVIIAWAIKYTWYSLKLSWGSDPEGFLFGEVLKVSDAPGEIGGFVGGVLGPQIFVWAVAFVILLAGVQKGIEMANRIFIPTLIVTFGIIVIRAVTLDGAAQGLEAFFKPDLTKLLDASVWVAAYSHIFFSMSIAFAIMVTYASYLPKKADVTNNAFITGFANSSFELLAGIGVFAALGFMAAQVNVPVEDVASAGVGLAFVVFPQIISEMTSMGPLFGFLFFLSLVLAGISSLISIAETYIAGLSDKFGISRTTAVIIGVGASAGLSLIYTTNGGLYFLDTVDYFVNHFGVAVLGLVEVVLVAWVFRELDDLRDHANSVSDIQLGAWWKLSLTTITPLLLGFMLFDIFRVNLMKLHDTANGNYGGLPDSFIALSGWSVSIIVIVVAIILTAMKWRNEPMVRINKKEESL